MNKLLVSAAVLVGLSAAPALAADLKIVTKAPPAVVVSPWDVAVGGAVMSDYNFRGVSQSNKGPSAGAYFEPQYKTAIGTFYVGLAGWAIDWPSAPAFGFTDPSAEIDIYGGWRNSWGPVSVDLGVIYYYYPKEIFNGFTSNSDFVELYAKLGYDFGSGLTVGANVFYTPDLLNYGAMFTTDVDATYVSATAKYVLPWTTGDLGAYVSGELGHWWISDTNFLVDPSYTYWNAGVALTYKALTLDLRYHGTDMSETECGNFLVVASSKWCGDTFIAALKFDTTLSALK